MVQPTIRPALALALCFAFSACALIYQQVLVFALYDYGGNFVLAQSLGLGVFLLGMGLGAADARGGARRLVMVELLLALLGAVAVPLVNAGEVLQRYFLPQLSPETAVLFFLPLSLVLGYLSGQEIPLLMRLSPAAPARRLLAASYFGGLVALIAVPALLLPVLDLAPSAISAAVVNFSLGATLAWRLDTGKGTKAAALLIALVLIPVVKFERALRDFHLKFIYFPVAYATEDQIEKDLARYDAMDPPLRQRSHYQWLDILPAGLSALGGEENAFSLFLDRRLQFNAETERRYHEAMAIAAQTLLGRPVERVIILGGGDGLLLPHVLQNKDVQRIDLVELDGAMLDLAGSNHALARLNAGSLRDPRVHVVNGDAFEFLRRREEHWDVILVDFPLPATYDLSLLYTREFYAFARARLAPDGILVMDFAWPDDDLSGLAVLLKTLKAAGFPRPFAFGQEDLFVAMARDGRELAFDFAKYGHRLSNQVLLSLVSRGDFTEAAAKQNARVNSLFFPYRFRFDYSGSQ